MERKADIGKADIGKETGVEMGNWQENTYLTMSKALLYVVYSYTYDVF